MIKAVIFDMDGVIVDSEIVYMKWTQQFLKTKGIAISEKKLYTMVGFSEQSTKGFLQKLWKDELGVDKDGESIYKEYDDFCEKFNLNYAKIRNPGIKELMECLKSNGIKIAIASSSPLNNINQVLRETNLAGYIDVIASGQMFHKSKPDPEIYNYTVNKLNLKKQECLVVEDSTYGITAAKRANIVVVAKEDKRFSFDQTRADYKIKNLIEVTQILDKLNTKN